MLDPDEATFVVVVGPLVEMGPVPGLMAAKPATAAANSTTTTATAANLPETNKHLQSGAHMNLARLGRQ